MAKLNNDSLRRSIRLIEGVAASADKNNAFVAAPVVANVGQDSVVPVRVMNISAAPIKLYAETRIGMASVVSEQHEKEMDLQVFSTERPSSGDGELADAWKSSPKFKDLDLSMCSLDKEHRKKVCMLLAEYEDIFASGDHDLKGTDFVRHGIHTGGAPPVTQKPYRVAFSLRQTIKTKIGDMLRCDIIEPPTSEWASPIVMVKKKDGSWRICVDYRKLNPATHKDSYPVKRFDDVTGSMGQVKCFCTLDLQSGYHQILMDDESKPETAFVTYEGLYQYTRMPFGMCNAPAPSKGCWNACYKAWIGERALCSWTTYSSLAKPESRCWIV